MKPDYRRIHELEYELGFRDDPPYPKTGWSSGAQGLWQIKPGAVIYYDPKQGRPTY